MDATSAWEHGHNRLVSSLLKLVAYLPKVAWLSSHGRHICLGMWPQQIGICWMATLSCMHVHWENHDESLMNTVKDEKANSSIPWVVRDFVLPAGFLGECWHPHVVWLCIYALLLLCHGVLTVEVQVYNLRNAVIDVFSNRNAANKLFCKLCTLIICILPFLPSTVKCTAWFCICISLSFL